MEFTLQPRIDCHVHVFDPARFPYADDAWYRPSGGETGTADNLGQVLDAHGVRHALIVGPNSGYGLDNRCLLDALARGEGRYKGIAVVRNDASRTELQDLQAAGVVGVAFNVALLGVDFYRDTGAPAGAPARPGAVGAGAGSGRRTGGLAAAAAGQRRAPAV